MLKKKMNYNLHYDVPFVANPDNRCVPASIGMVLAYFIPQQQWSMAELDRLVGYEDGKGTWQTQLMLALHDLGFELRWIEDFDWPRFARDPAAYLATILDPEALQWQLTHSDLPREAQRWQQYAARGLPFEQRPGTAKDITGLLDEGFLVRLDVNAATLADAPGYEPHSVIVTGYTQQGVTLHNPDSVHGNQPNQFVSWQKLHDAWKAYGGSFSMYAYRIPPG